MFTVAPRLHPVPPEQWTDATRDVFAASEGREGWEHGSKFNVIGLLANHPQLAAPYLNYSLLLMRAPVIAERLREIVVLRVAWRHQCEYEWVQHVAIAREHGLGPEHLEAVKQGAEAALWSDLERHALRAVDQLCETSHLDDATWQGLAAELDRAQMLELLFIIGTYSMLAWIFNATGLQLETEAPG